MESSDMNDRERALAEAVRAACIQAAIEGYENASVSGLCGEGAFEAAVSAMRMVDLGALRAQARIED